MDVALRSRLLTEHGFRHGFSLRTGGVSAAPFDSLNLGRNVGDEPAAVTENRRRFARDVGYDDDALFEVSQVHGAAARALTPSDGVETVRSVEADAIVARAGRGAIGIRVADCAPVLVANVRTRSVAAVHAGWRGTVAGVVAVAVRALLAETGSAPAELVAAIGPHIRAGAFEVGDDVASAIAAAAHGRDVVRRAEPRPFADLTETIRAQLEHLGLAPSAIDDVAGCTFTESERFFSFRRDGQRSGRHLAVIVA